MRSRWRVSRYAGHTVYEYSTIAVSYKVGKIRQILWFLLKLQIQTLIYKNDDYRFWDFQELCTRNILIIKLYSQSTPYKNPRPCAAEPLRV